MTSDTVPASGDLKRGHVLIVGGTHGTGRAVVRRFAEDGHRVSVLGRRRPPEVDLSGSEIFFCLTDLADSESRQDAINQCVRHFGPFRHVVFCQRYRGQGNTWDGELQVSLTATDEIIRLAAQRIDGTVDHSIAIISSMASRLVYEEQPVSYHAVKAALNQLVRFYAVHLGPQRIRLNAVLPATVLKEESNPFYTENAQLCERYKEITPLRRMGTSDDIANLIWFLSSAEASFITGQEIGVDGGVSLVGHTSLAAKLQPPDRLKMLDMH
jgi:NAD(P)-dependent dehydrogenase (short-subunit alcohol dehydrogenase family)